MLLILCYYSVLIGNHITVQTQHHVCPRVTLKGFIQERYGKRYKISAAIPIAVIKHSSKRFMDLLLLFHVYLFLMCCVSLLESRGATKSINVLTVPSS